FERQEIAPFDVDEFFIEVEQERLTAFLVDENLPLTHRFDERLRGSAEESRFRYEFQIARVARNGSALHVNAAAEIDLEESILMQREGLRRSFDLLAEVEPLLLGELRFVDGFLQLAGGRVGGIDDARSVGRHRDAA